MRDTLTRAGMNSYRQFKIDIGLVILYWFVLSMRMQVILDSSFRPPGFSPYTGREERRVQGLDYLTIIPRVRRGYESIAHEAEGRMGY